MIVESLEEADPVSKEFSRIYKKLAIGSGLILLAILSLFLGNYLGSAFHPDLSTLGKIFAILLLAGAVAVQKEM